MTYDLPIANAQICDGTGAALSHGAVEVKDRIITDVGSVSGPATRTINANGCAVAPGFITTPYPLRRACLMESAAHLYGVAWDEWESFPQYMQSGA